MTYYIEYLEDFLKKIGVPACSRENILHIYDCITITEEKCKRIDEIISQYKDIDFDYTKVINDFADFALPRLRNKCEVDCLCICLLSKQLEVLYKKYGYSEELFVETMSDIRYKIAECELVEKLSGIFCSSWYEDFFKLKTFSLGRLQFQLVDNCYDIPGYSKDYKMIAVHVPRSGEKLDPDKVDESIKRAKIFFKEKFGINEPVFVVHSWLLWSGNEKFISSESNIIKFAKRFTIIKTDLTTDYSDLWRIFDRKIDRVKFLSEETSLTKGYKELIKKHKPVGQSIGYFRG